MALGNDLILSRKEAAQMLRVSAPTLDKAIRAGTVPSIRIGRRILIPLPALRRMLAGEPIQMPVTDKGKAGPKAGPLA